MTVEGPHTFVLADAGGWTRSLRYAGALLTPEETASVLVSLGRGASFRAAAAPLAPFTGLTGRGAAQLAQRHAATAAAAVLPSAWPDVVMVGLVDLAGTESAPSRLDAAGWGLMAAGVWVGGQTGTLVTARACSGSDTVAWEQFLRSLSGSPRVVVGPPAGELRLAVGRVWGPSSTGGPTWLTSQWHLRRDLRRAAGRDGLRLGSAELDAAFSSVEAWWSFASGLAARRLKHAMRWVETWGAEVAGQLAFVAAWAEDPARDGPLPTSCAVLDVQAEPVRGWLRGSRVRPGTRPQLETVVPLMVAEVVGAADMDAYAAALRRTASSRGDR